MARFRQITARAYWTLGLSAARLALDDGLARRHAGDSQVPGLGILMSVAAGAMPGHVPSGASQSLCFTRSC